MKDIAIDTGEEGFPDIHMVRQDLTTFPAMCGIPLYCNFIYILKKQTLIEQPQEIPSLLPKSPHISLFPHALL
jgi:hypothetical protein